MEPDFFLKKKPSQCFKKARFFFESIGNGKNETGLETLPGLEFSGSVRRFPGTCEYQQNDVNCPQ